MNLSLSRYSIALGRKTALHEIVLAYHQVYRDHNNLAGRLAFYHHVQVQAAIGIAHKRRNARVLQQIAGSSTSQAGEEVSSASSSHAAWPYMECRHVLDLLGTWKCYVLGMLSRRNFNRLLRPRVPKGHIRLTWICVSTISQLLSTGQS